MIANIPQIRAGIVAVSRDCFPESLSVNRRRAVVEAYEKNTAGRAFTNARSVLWRASCTCFRHWRM